MREKTQLVATILIFLALCVAWFFFYVKPAEDHRNKVWSCMAELPNMPRFEAYKACHNDNIGQAGLLIGFFDPPIPVGYHPPRRR